MELLLEESQLQGKQAKAKDEEYQALYQHKVGCILDKINTAVKTYCTHNKIEVLYKLDVLQQAVAYYNEKHDITEELITKVR
jgi:Skp family chaperone for outer membrane proteins